MFVLLLVVLHTSCNVLLAIPLGNDKTIAKDWCYTIVTDVTVGTNGTVYPDVTIVTDGTIVTDVTVVTDEIMLFTDMTVEIGGSIDLVTDVTIVTGGTVVTDMTIVTGGTV